MMTLFYIEGIETVAYEIMNRCILKDPKYFSKKKFEIFGIKTTAIALELRDYDTLWRTHSRTFLEVCIEYYTENEMYENCYLIKKGFDEFDCKQRLSIVCDYYNYKKRGKVKDCQEIKDLMNKYWPFEAVL